MIHIVVTKHGNDILEISSRGHAEYGDKGKDLVCAGVSSIIFGLLNVLEECKVDYSYNQQDNLIETKIIKPTHDSNVMLNVVDIQLNTIRESYPEYVEIEYKEV